MNLRIGIAGILVVLLLLFTCGCEKMQKEEEASIHHTSLLVEETDKTLTCRLPDGETSVIPKHPKRTVILLTSLLNLWVEAGGSAIARCSGAINIPPTYEAIPQVGSFSNPNVEKIISLEPDLVISSDVANFRALIPIFKQNNIPFAYFRYINYHDYLHILELFAKVNGTSERYLAAYEEMATKVKSIVDQCKRYPSPKVLTVFTTSNAISCELPSSQTGVMLSMLGAKNIIPSRFHTDSKTRIDFSLERIVELDPDIILLNTMGDVEACRERLKKEFESNAAWSALRAIQTHRFYVLPKVYFLYKPNDRFPEALQYLAELIYPGFSIDGATAVDSTTAVKQGDLQDDPKGSSLTMQKSIDVTTIKESLLTTQKDKP